MDHGFSYEVRRDTQNVPVGASVSVDSGRGIISISNGGYQFKILNRSEGGFSIHADLQSPDELSDVALGGFIKALIDQK